MSSQVIDISSSPEEEPPAKRVRTTAPTKAVESQPAKTQGSEQTTPAVKRVLDLLAQPTSEVLAEIQKMDEAGLVLLQASLVKMAGSSGPSATAAKQELLPAVQRTLVKRKLEKMRAVQANDSARQELITKKLEGESDDLFRVELKRAGAVNTTAVCRRVWGTSENIRKADINFTLRIPYNQAAEKFSNPAAALAITSDISEFLEYFNSRTRAGIAVLKDLGLEVCLLPPGPVARAIIGVETLTRDDALGKLPLLLVVKIDNVRD